MAERWIVIAVMALLGVPALAAGPSRPAWKWTLEERLVGRFDDTAVARRAEKLGLQSGVDMVAGRDDPALLLPHELFDAFLSETFPSPAQVKAGASSAASRARVEASAVALGFGQDMWDRLGGLPEVREMLSLRDAPPVPVGGGRPAAPSADDVAWCRARARAMAAAKREFGGEAILRLLYEVEAPTFARAYQASPGLKEELRRQEEGCP